MVALLLGVTLLSVTHLTQSYPYPTFSEKKYTRAQQYQPTYSYIPVAIPYSMPQMYDENQDEMSIPGNRYYYYPISDDMRATNEDISQDVDFDQNYPFGQEMWYEGGFENEAMRAAANAEARAAFLRNLIITQMYQDAAASAAVSGGSPSRYMYKSPYQQMPVSNDYDENKKYMYGVPTSGVEEAERAKQFLRDEDEEVKELETLRKAANKEGKRRRKQKAKEAQEKKQDSDVALVTVTPLMSEGSRRKDRKNTVASGQKEVVLPQPMRPARQPFAELAHRLHTRSENPSAYQTIKQLLAMENDVKKTDDSKLRKRFVSTEEQLTAQLSSLKKSTL